MNTKHNGNDIVLSIAITKFKLSIFLLIMLCSSMAQNLKEEYVYEAMIPDNVA